MLRLILAILFAALGGTLLLHYLKNFCLKEKVKLHLDWDGVLERFFITGIALKAPDMWPIILLIITIRVLYRIFFLDFCPALFQRPEPGIAAQKVRLKAELAFDLIVSPAFAILVGVVFQ